LSLYPSSLHVIGSARVAISTSAPHVVQNRYEALIIRVPQYLLQVGRISDEGIR